MRNLILSFLLGLFASVHIWAEAETAIPKNDIKNVSSTKPTKEVKKQAKRLKKEGWKIFPEGALLEIQIAECQQMELEQIADKNGNYTSRYIMATGLATASTIDIGKTMARVRAQEEIAGLLETHLTALIESELSNIQRPTGEVRSTSKFAMHSKSIIKGTLNHCITVLSIHRPLDNGTVEVQIRLALDKQLLAEQISSSVE